MAADHGVVIGVIMAYISAGQPARIAKLHIKSVLYNPLAFNLCAAELRCQLATLRYILALVSCYETQETKTERQIPPTDPTACVRVHVRV